MNINSKAIEWENAPNGKKASIEASTLGLPVDNWPSSLTIEIKGYPYIFYRGNMFSDGNDLGGFVYTTHPDLFILTVFND